MIQNLKNKLQNKDNKKLLSNFMSLLSLQGLNFLLPLLTMPYLFRVLGVEKYGLIAFSLSVVTFLNVFVSYGFHLSATREISIHRDNKEKLSEIFSNTLTAKLFLLLLSFMILTILTFSIDYFSQYALLFCTSFILVIGNSIFPIWFFQGMEEMKYIGYFNLIAKLFFTAGIFLFIKTPSDYLIQPLLNGLGILLVGVYSIYFINKTYQIKFARQPISSTIETLKNSWNIFLSELMPNLYNNFATFLLGLVTTMESVGYYALATQIINVFNSIMYIIRNVTYPYLSKNFDKFKQITKLTIAIGAISSIIIYSLSYFILPLLFGEKVYNSLSLIYILGLTPFIFAFTLSFGSNKLLVLKQDKLYKNIVLKTSLFGFIASCIVIPFFYAAGAAIVMLLTRAILAISVTRVAINLEKKK